MAETTHRRIIIGDVHGHYKGLQELLGAIAPGKADQVYLLGDLVDRGPQSPEVVSFVREHGYSCLLGNHEQLFLESFPDGKIASNALQAWLYSGGQTTVESYMNRENGIDLLIEHVKWLATLPTYLDLGDVWLAHAGVDPKLSVEMQTTHELCWVREEFLSIPEPYFPDKLIITGHTITFTLPGVSPGEVAQGYGWMDIDTGAYHPKSGWLTGLDLTHQMVYQFNVYQNCSRKLPLAEITTWVDPSDITDRYQHLRKQSAVSP
ncbi:serine/threonine protein phosphatase [Leptolyngbya sp. 'hensonii']|uniref:metallophosphoesterase n=1 Tax=Leptolyngbya sp. 'hensonii' TaxID=1922337 RepID=UPI00094F7BF3|nr:metallophosphoesterase [Leptolyngbya sp. 'hensonii']OLP20339.1 serine/threonine protein phosphatase [Leptolyngbya sp. 'hensonii']